MQNSGVKPVIYKKAKQTHCPCLTCLNVRKDIINCKEFITCHVEITTVMTYRAERESLSLSTFLKLAVFVCVCVRACMC